MTSTGDPPGLKLTASVRAATGEVCKRALCQPYEFDNGSRIGWQRLGRRRHLRRHRRHRRQRRHRVHRPRRSTNENFNFPTKIPFLSFFPFHSDSNIAVPFPLNFT